MISIITSLAFIAGAVFDDIRYRKRRYFVKPAREIREETKDFSSPYMVKFSTVEEVGFVKNIEGAFATVAVPKKSACEGCSLKICKPEQQFMEIQALNSIHAQVGQKVKVVLKSYTYLKSSMVIYGIPALALVGGAVIGKELFGPFFAGSDPDMVSAVSGFGAFVLSFLLIKLWSFSAGKKTEAKPVIEEILAE